MKNAFKTLFTDFASLILVVTLTVFALMITGCATIRDVADRLNAPENAAKAIDTYGQTTPYAERLKIRDEVNALTQRCDIQITCDGDPAQ